MAKLPKYGFGSGKYGFWIFINSHIHYIILRRNQQAAALQATYL
jgi:hypothetical protein